MDPVQQSGDPQSRVEAELKIEKLRCEIQQLRGQLGVLGDALTREQFISIFKMYEDKGWAVKQQMLAVFGLLTPVVFALLAFCAKDHLSNTMSATTTVASWTTFALSLFMAFLIVLSLLHANRDYTRSHQLVEQANAEGLFPQEVLKVIRGEERKHDPSLWHKGFGYIGWQFIAIMFLGLFLVVVSLLVALAVTWRGAPRAIMFLGLFLVVVSLLVALAVTWRGAPRP